MRWEFQDDTGAFMAMIDDDDLMDLESQSGKKANVAGYQNAIGVSGDIPIKIVELMITLPSQTHPGQTWLPFFKIFCAVKKRAQGSSHRCRLLGPWLRHVLYTGTSPDGKNRLFMFDQKSEFRAIPASTIPIGRRWIHHLSYADQLAQAPP